MTQTVHLKTLLDLRVPPVAIGQFSEPPPGVERYEEAPMPAGCTFWQIAQQGHVFYTLPEDHHCAVGSYTHNMKTSPDADLNATINLMVESRYMRAEEIAGIPTLNDSPRAVAYAPVEAAAFEPSVVIVAAAPAKAMLLFEAALRAGVSEPIAPLIARPGCAAVPQAVNEGMTVISFGCIANRMLTALPDAELYLAIPGRHWPAVVGALPEIIEANASMTPQ